jgi:hypothetical protein
MCEFSDIQKSIDKMQRFRLQPRQGKARQGHARQSHGQICRLVLPILQCVKQSTDLLLASVQGRMTGASPRQWWYLQRLVSI